uniref:Organic solute transporter subunit alpha n=1 Tax=Meloidogyne floridensis TaxID=298350 RepID=A0A915PCU2_9BILA
MDFVRQLLCTGIKDQECNITEEEIPRVGEFFESIELIYLMAICVASIITIIIFILGIVHWIFVLKFISNEQIRTDLYWLVFMGPVISTCGTIGLVIPRAAIFLYAIALVYFMICIFVLVCLMLTLNGSRQILCEKLMAKGVKISLRVCPLGCCLFCLSKVEPNQLNFRRMEWLVFQSPIVRIFLEVVNIIVFMEINSRANLFTQISNVIGMISLFVGSYGSYMIIPAGSSLLGEYRLHIFSTKSVLPASAKAQFCISFLLCVEMLIVSLLATFMFRPSRT